VGRQARRSCGPCLRLREKGCRDGASFRQYFASVASYRAWRREDRGIPGTIPARFGGDPGAENNISRLLERIGISFLNRQRAAFYKDILSPDRALTEAVSASLAQALIDSSYGSSWPPSPGRRSRGGGYEASAIGGLSGASGKRARALC